MTVLPLVTFVHVSDTHLTGKDHPDYQAHPNAHETTRAVFEQINSLPVPVDFVLHTGDVGHDPKRESDYMTVLSTLKVLQPPLHVIAGNHDRSKWLYRTVNGRVPDTYHYAFEVNGVYFACLDSSIAHQGNGRLGDAQLTWLENIVALPTDQPLVVVVHHHPIALGSPPMDAIGLNDGEALHRVLRGARKRVRCVLFGHIHEDVTIMRDGILYASARSTWYQTRTWPRQKDFTRDPVQVPGYNLVTIMPNGDTIIRAYRVPYPTG
ncbi:MAG: hypothetical protein DCC53_07815 [Chloroflexi bacterium]|jgi:Icc protein|nr:3',5'-cyclic adenosine monophosphate phosphodiesterase CpdA [Anaerolineae bacterium]MDL1914441.1 hypothetical protein [Anaerolineae bacterium CFX4]OQY85577.1 MAG: hypothetical protein B6D42_03070 [Anaerolineae bacterium UTCFX5]RIK21224.1 MAG: hypothetical protein DCC53_07815 [Chloroflexota bacterium]GIK29281.1 MAG: 3',5'-cyclic adenosine monophosphate phosphodiesterase CpdA [Chloroflexota bacterium]